MDNLILGFLKNLRCNKVSSTTNEQNGESNIHSDQSTIDNRQPKIPNDRTENTENQSQMDCSINTPAPESFSEVETKVLMVNQKKISLRKIMLPAKNMGAEDENVVIKIRKINTDNVYY